jgi:hypothetical protein
MFYLPININSSRLQRGGIPDTPMANGAGLAACPEIFLIMTLSPENYTPIPL